MDSVGAGRVRPGWKDEFEKHLAATRLQQDLGLPLPAKSASSSGNTVVWRTGSPLAWEAPAGAGTARSQQLGEGREGPGKT